jgi:ribosomal protein S18 acetylase RimI-like enzyme
MMVRMEIREAIPTDEPAMHALWDLGEPEPMTHEYWLSVLEVRGPESFPLRSVAAADGAEPGDIAGMVMLLQFHLPPDWAQVVVKVGLEHRRKGLGELLWREAFEHPVGRDAPVLLVNIRDDDSDSRAFSERRGFSLWAHRFQSFLEVGGFDGSRFADAIAATEASGIRIGTLADIVGRAELVDSYFQLYRRASLTTPDNDQGVEPKRDDFDRFYLDPEQHPPEATILAFEEDEVVGMTSIQVRGPGFVYTSMTGVNPDHRGRGIALAIKVRSVEAARALGAERMGTNNLSINAPILAINDKMGYVRQPGLWLMRRPR